VSNLQIRPITDAFFSSGKPFEGLFVMVKMLSDLGVGVLAIYHLLAEFRPPPTADKREEKLNSHGLFSPDTE
jgi:hypothetical protein